MTMKLSAVFLFLFSLNLSAGVYSQTKVSLKLEQATLEEFISAVKSQTGMQFLYNSVVVKGKEKISLDITNEEVKAVLDKVLPSFNLEYKIINDVVVLQRKGEKGWISDENKEVIKGKVVDTKGLPLPGVTIRLKGTSLGTATDTKGLFTLEFTGKVDTIVVSFFGMKTQYV